MTSFEQIRKTMASGSKEQKIKLLESLSDASDAKTVLLIISALDDADIEVRGEAFSSLVLNINDVSDILIESLKDPSKNVRGYSALVLANRNDKNAIPNISQLTDDESAMVRSCAVGALGYLKANEACLAIRKCLDDSNIEVIKSAIKSAIDIGDKNLLTKIEELSKVDDPEVHSLIVLAKDKL
jgi:HEAT repeat protein